MGEGELGLGDLAQAVGVFWRGRRGGVWEPQMNADWRRWWGGGDAGRVGHARIDFCESNPIWGFGSGGKLRIEPNFGGSDFGGFRGWRSMTLTSLVSDWEGGANGHLDYVEWNEVALSPKVGSPLGVIGGVVAGWCPMAGTWAGQCRD